MVACPDHFIDLNIMGMDVLQRAFPNYREALQDQLSRGFAVREKGVKAKAFRKSLDIEMAAIEEFTALVRLNPESKMVPYWEKTIKDLSAKFVKKIGDAVAESEEEEENTDRDA